MGNKAKNWKWGHIHTLEIQHVLGIKWPFNYIFNLGPTAMSGSLETVNNQFFYLENKNLKDK